MDQSLWLLLAVTLSIYFWRRQRDPLNAIPTVGGPSAPLLSYIGAFRYFTHAHRIIQEGYRKYQGRAFKVAMFDQWLVILSGSSELIEQVRQLPDDVMSHMDGLFFLTQMDKFISPNIADSPHQIEVIRDKLARKLGTVVTPMAEELQAVCGDLISAEDGETVSLPAVPMLLDVVTRVVSHAFVGTPTCRNKAFLDATVSFTIDLVKARVILNLFPIPMKPIIAKFIRGPCANIERFQNVMKPVVAERLRLLQCSNTGEEKDIPDDFLQWLVTECHKHNESATDITTRLHLTNFAAVHTSSNTLTHAFFHLVAHEEIFATLREEIQNALDAEGWTKAAFDKMWKLDSLLKESQRMSAMNILGLVRQVHRDVTLEDGTFLPKGTMVAVPLHSIHTDAGNYDRPDEFLPFRFSDSREAGDGARHRHVNTSAKYMPFGRGKHACPGRFFASLQLKMILAYLLLNYDMKFAGKGGRPADLNIGFSVLPSRNAVVEFTKRSRP